MPEEQNFLSPDSGREPGFDQVLERLQRIVARIEQGNLPLDQALTLYEEGVRLARRGNAILDATGQRIEQLCRNEDGTETRRPLPAPETT